MHLETTVSARTTWQFNFST